MTQARTAREHFKTYDAAGWYSRILSVMREDPEQPWCIADLARELGAEKSTISARLNELHTQNQVEIAGEFPSKATGIRARHYQLKQQQALL